MFRLAATHGFRLQEKELELVLLNVRGWHYRGANHVTIRRVGAQRWLGFRVSL